MSEKRIAAGPDLHLFDADVNVSLSKPAYNGTIDQFAETRLRIGVIDNPTIQRDFNKKLDPIRSQKIINMSTGKICIRWIDQQGGLIRPPEFGQSGDDEQSDREMLTLSHPIIWANDENWMGLNYLPPIGSIVIVGFRKHNLPVLLGYIQSHYQVCYPLELGEMQMKGYGQNLTHHKIHDEWEAKAWVGEKQIRLENKKNGEWVYGPPVPYSVGLKLRIKAWKDPKNPNDSKEMIELYAYKTQGPILLDHSFLEVRPEQVYMWSENPINRKIRSQTTITPDNIVSKSIKLDAPKVSTTIMNPNSISNSVTNGGDTSTTTQTATSFAIKAKNIAFNTNRVDYNDYE